MSRSIVDSQGTLRPLLRLAWPVLVEYLLHTLVGFSDHVLAGRYLEQKYLAPVNLTLYVLWLLDSLFVVVAIGATAMVARFVGAKDFRTARRVTNQSFLIGILFAVFATVVGLAGGPPLVRTLQLTGEAADMANLYLAHIYPVLPFVMALSVGVACLRGAGDMVSGLVVMLVVNAVNVVVSWSLVLGIGGLPAMGWQGLAIGTATGYVVGGCIVVGMLIGGRARLWLRVRMLKPDRDLIRRLLRIGLPGGTDILLIIACQLWFVAIINQLDGPGTGHDGLNAAAHGVAIRIESLSFLPGAAFQAAAATLAGQFLGAGDYRRATRSVATACLVGGGLMSVCGVVFYVAAEPLCGLIVSSDKAEVVATAAPLLRVIALAQPALALVMILSGALRGAGDTRWPLIFSLLGNLGIRIPATYFLAHHLGWEVLGAWYAMTADLYVRCLLVMFRFWHGGWRRVQV